MSDQQGPPVINGMAIQDPLEAINALVNGVIQCAQAAAGEQNAAEAKDYAAAALSLAQAAITLDPSRLTGGDTPEARRDSVPPQLPPTKDGNKDGKIG